MVQIGVRLISFTVFTVMGIASLPDSDNTYFLSWNIPGSSHFDAHLRSPRLFSDECTGQPTNPFLSSGAWSTTHRNSYAQSTTSVSFLNGAHQYVVPQKKDEIPFVNQGSNTTRRGAGRISGSSRQRKASQVIASLALQPGAKPQSLADSGAKPLSLEELANLTSEALVISAKSNTLTTYDFLLAPALIADPISLLYTPDNKYIWGSSFTSTFKVDRSGPTLRVVDTITKKSLSRSSSSSRPSEDLFHGAYSLLSNEVVG